MQRKVWQALMAVMLTTSWLLAGGKGPNDRDPLATKDSHLQDQWVDSVFHSMTFEERLGQLFMVAAYSNKDEKHKQEIAKLIQEQHLGGLIFFQGGPVRQAHLTNYYQSISKTPLYLAMDAEWGISMRLDSMMQYPKQMTLGAIQDDRLVYNMGKEIARQFKELGMHINFAPVVDVNSNPQNPVIGYRAFGEQKELVTQKSLAYMKGMQDHGIMANAKHFPGHGDTESDSHYTLPVIKHGEQRIRDIDLYPYQALIDQDLMSVMVAHLHVPSLDSEPNRATTLSKKVVTDMLKNEMNFNGLIFTDALNMKGVSSFHKPGEVDLLALLAGNDILLYSQDVAKAKQLILEAVKDGKITQEEIDGRIRKVLRAKYWSGLHQQKPIDTNRLVERINTNHTKGVIEELYASSISVIANQNNFLPLKNIDMLNMASITIGGGQGKEFKKQLSKYGKFKHFDLSKSPSSMDYNNLEANLQDYNTVVVGITGMTNNPKRNFGLNESDIHFIKKLSAKHNVIAVMFGNSYGAKQLEGLSHVVMAYEENEFTEKLVPQVIFGARAAEGRLPVTASKKFPFGSGMDTKKLSRLAYSTPETQGVDSRSLLEIDRKMNEAIQKKATPGGVVLVAKNGHVIFEKAYGHLDYQKSRPVTTETVYDLASITKVMSTTSAVMFLQSQQLLDMDASISQYLPDLRDTNKGKLKIRDIMTHEAGLKPYIPFHSKTLEGGKWKNEFYSAHEMEGYNIQLGTNMYAINSLRDSLWKWSLEADLKTLPKGQNKFDYTYSDIGMYIMQRVTERLLNQPLNDFMEHNFYEPLGLYTLTYLPHRKLDLDMIAPTEEDRSFRKNLVRGFVHDQGAAMYGGVAGHAGLFGTANDLAVMMQMLLQGGKYGDVHLLDEKTVHEFTRRQSEQSRRGWGWDKPEVEKGKNGSTGKLAPKSTFGHTGFTGTAVWADPDNQLIYVFLSNRVYPDASNNTLLKEGYRTEIHDIIYKSLRYESLNNYAQANKNN
ncbi:serine hydrolase [Litoribacter ruber]|uniref:beta-N-acetylhexosaminidase n=1 Tax=Litoribacter ruber TaxID=702568 RepID=A0AAP2CE13_9BACT|nr:MULTISPECIES: glycoside hydrolase family 3 N-terminal domain-containing protein [Litoribacter]MBS9522438.1 serine hydrolase [Litoribacter alkaliphilus]MBT0810958.1 serine hydrolase [Litoribacter ruber]